MVILAKVFIGETLVLTYQNVEMGTIKFCWGNKITEK